MSIKSAKQLVSAANAEVDTITPEAALALAKKPDVTLVDVRESDEVLNTGKLKGAVHVPRGFLEFKADPQSPSHESAIRPDKHLVLYCASGNRSALAAKTLKGMGFDKVAHVAGGFAALKSAGGTPDTSE